MQLKFIRTFSVRALDELGIIAVNNAVVRSGLAKSDHK